MAQPTELEVAAAPAPAHASAETTTKDGIQKAFKIYARFKDALSKLVDEATRVKSLDQSNQHLTELNDILESVLLHGFKNRRQWLRSSTLNRPITSADVWPFIQFSLEYASSNTLVVSPDGTPSTSPLTATGFGSFSSLSSLASRAYTSPNSPTYCSAFPATVATTNLLSTVVALTESASETRTKKYLLMALMQQTLGDHIHSMSEFPQLNQWYEPWAIMRTPDIITPISGMLQGLSQLEFNFCLKESETSDDENLNKLKYKPSVSQLLLDRGEEVLKSGLAATWTTFGRVQSRVEAARGMLDLSKPIDRSASPELVAAKDSISKLASDQQALTNKLDEALEALNSERRARLAIEVELVSVKMARDKEVTRLRKEMGRLGNQLTILRLEPTDVQQLLLQSQDEVRTLREQLERAKLVARLAKVQLDKCYADVGNNDADAQSRGGDQNA
ncbi:hypothetical protein BATDEDRAFT_87030 [Batrachochytrium dendrobatidis JAM81]|uniref:RUN domain-containing protein n=1 Tax=Batrachochytrium dendrobatidis (strain JAM81 / FGSC 10211) TaxID=684364 RepID=F4NY47_BATDJ|nr:uncharacterized protein BATDEDRAFT_87030 [Batrachochytrium dendrobatidis JAM81]EGF82261.1 hypothetical protein BATDEDRAFT_87030 [Batrachochytrium dendrobatidis JAM81]KAK5670630.1 hypothetical protein QVD99_002412 [Batrachochytrium dendrobatidis]|eukprot:XP_006677684.1 hypothetical protein BATDEDRAFT_87030 [Batrachochytrium dendrobatidis JAM81]